MTLTISFDGMSSWAFPQTNLQVVLHDFQTTFTRRAMCYAIKAISLWGQSLTKSKLVQKMYFCIEQMWLGIIFVKEDVLFSNCSCHDYAEAFEFMLIFCIIRKNNTSSKSEINIALNYFHFFHPSHVDYLKMEQEKWKLAIEEMPPFAIYFENSRHVIQIPALFVRVVISKILIKLKAKSCRNKNA